MHTFLPFVPQVMYGNFGGRGMLRERVVFLRFLGRACSAHEQMVTSFDVQCSRASLALPLETEVDLTL